MTERSQKANVEGAVGGGDGSGVGNGIVGGNDGIGIVTGEPNS